MEENNSIEAQDQESELERFSRVLEQDCRRYPRILSEDL